MIYLYMAKRDKKGIKILTIFKGKEISRTLVNDINKLNLPDNLSQDITNTIQENKMLWETWIEYADNFNDFRSKLTARGYSNLPIKSKPIHQPQGMNSMSAIGNIPPPKKPMLQRGSVNKNTKLTKPEIITSF